MGVITITTTHGEFHGRTIDSIVRTQYGRKAIARHSGDRNDPRWGQVLQANPYGGWDVLARILSVSSDVRDAAVDEYHQGAERL